MSSEVFLFSGTNVLEVDWDDIPQWYYELIGCKVVKIRNRSCYFSSDDGAIGVFRVMLDDVLVLQKIMRHYSGEYEDYWFYLGCDQGITSLQDMPNWMNEIVSLFEQNGEYFELESKLHVNKKILVYYPKRLLKDRTECKFHSEMKTIVETYYRG